MIIGEIDMTNKEKKAFIGNKIFAETEVDGQLVLCALTRFEYLQMKLLSIKTGYQYVIFIHCRKKIKGDNKVLYD